jgi:adenosylcobinamide-GDP ribazoletransferase
MRDITMQPLHDMLSGLGLLTRLPVPATGRHRPEAAWCWPIVGTIIATLALLPGLGLITAGASNGIAAAVVMGAGMVVTGALHEDGLADTADGLFGGWTREKRLEIMKDSRVGTYGMLALLIISLANWSLIGSLLLAGHWPALIAAGALSRAPMAVLMASMANARKGGLSAGVGRPRLWSALTASGLALLLTLALLQDGAVVAVMTGAVVLATLGVAVLAQSRIGGQTGDILGAAQQMAFTACLLAAELALQT